MKIRLAEQSDLNAVLQLSQRGFDYDLQFDPTLNMAWSQSSTAREYFSSKINSKDALFLVALAEQDVVGFLAAGSRNSEPYRQPMTIAELEVMFVADRFRSQGVGNALVKEFYAWAKTQDCKCARVVASAGNVRAVKFYRESGFIDYTATLEKKL